MGTRPLTGRTRVSAGQPIDSAPSCAYELRNPGTPVALRTHPCFAGVPLVRSDHDNVGRGVGEVGWASEGCSASRGSSTERPGVSLTDWWAVDHRRGRRSTRNGVGYEWGEGNDPDRTPQHHSGPRPTARAPKAGRATPSSDSRSGHRADSVRRTAETVNAACRRVTPAKWTGCLSRPERVLANRARPPCSVSAVSSPRGLKETESLVTDRPEDAPDPCSTMVRSATAGR